MSFLTITGKTIAALDAALTHKGELPITPYTSAGVITFIADTYRPSMTDSLSGFITAGLKVGDLILVNGSPSNDSILLIDNLVAGTLNLSNTHAGEITGEAAGAGTVTISTPTQAEVQGIDIIINNAGRLVDADGDTQVQVEEAADEDKIRFDAAGTQEAQIDANGLTLKTGASVNELSTDGTLAGNSDDAVPTEQAVKTYVDGVLAAHLHQFHP